MGENPWKLVVVAIICFLPITFLRVVFFSSDVDQRKQKLLDWAGCPQGNLAKQEPTENHLRRLVTGEDRDQLETTGFVCHSDLISDICITTKPVRINTKELTVHISGPQAVVTRTIKPYPFKPDKYAMEKVSALKLIHGNKSFDLPTCNFTHNIPALVFSSGGYNGNFFHEIAQSIIPIFLTSYHFQTRLKFIITDYKAWWVNKYDRVLSHLSPYNVINPAADGSVHCFPGAVIGLRSQDLISINSVEVPEGYTLADFRDFMKQSYELKIKNVLEIKKPALVLISRTTTRKFLNEDEMVRMMEEMGFQVMVARPDWMSDLNKFAEVINSCKVMVGAHGAGLTNELFLPDGAVMVEVVPLGMEWASIFFYGDSESKLGLKYLDYKIQPHESSLYDQYGKDHMVVNDPMSIFLQSYYVARKIYFNEQDLNIDVGRFNETLVKAMELIGGSSP